MATTTTASIARFQHSPCDSTCNTALYSDREIKWLCLPIRMDMRDIEKVDAIVRRSRSILTGHHVYRLHDLFHSVYVVHSGSIKMNSINDAGDEQVTGFCLPGEVFGLDGVGTHRYACNAIALQTSTVYEIPFDRLEKLAHHLPILQHHFFELMGRQIASNQQMLLTLGKKNAEARVATLLISLSSRYSRLNLSPNAMRLPMSRMDIGNFLGLTIETVSRMFSQLQRKGIIDVNGRDLLIKDHARLDALC